MLIEGSSNSNIYLDVFVVVIFRLDVGIGFLVTLKNLREHFWELCLPKLCFKKFCL